MQYFAVVEPQRRLAPQLHTALRGAIPRATLRDVTAATYLALWWPPIDTAKYDAVRGDELPKWDPVVQAYYDPTTGELLPRGMRHSSSTPTTSNRCTLRGSDRRST